MNPSISPNPDPQIGVATKIRVFVVTSYLEPSIYVCVTVNIDPHSQDVCPQKMNIFGL